jgi:hypothetical protein
MLSVPNTNPGLQGARKLKYFPPAVPPRGPTTDPGGSYRHGKKQWSGPTQT